VEDGDNIQSQGGNAGQADSGSYFKIAVVIPALHRPDLTGRCVEWLAKQRLPPNHLEAIIVENDARPESIFPDPLPSNTRRILLEKNYGTTGSINRAASISSSKYILLLNNDIELHPEFLKLTSSFLDAHPEYGFVTGKLINGRDHARLDGAGDALLLGGGAYRLGYQDLDLGHFDHESPVLAGCGAATLVRRSVFEEIGGLDEDFFAYLDDVDLGMRSQLAGHKGKYLPRAVAYHLGSTTLGSPTHPRIIQLVTQNQILMLAKNYPAGVLLKIMPRVLVYQALWMLWAGKQSFSGYLRGLAGALRLLPRVLRKRKAVAQRCRLNTREIMELLRASEEQIRNWHYCTAKAEQSWLLRVYLGLLSV
jgi:GT2 family glycosyltransferase